ncbi:MAG: DUF2721 domain-containing protein [Pseudomonadota bacterium]
MELANPSHLVGEVIQLALAPAFLLVAIGSFLNVVTQRLARVIDRSRDLEEKCKSDKNMRRDPAVRSELMSLGRRIQYAQWATTFCAISALIIAVLVAVLFITDLIKVDAAVPLAVLFSSAMATLIAGILAFMSEVLVATRTVRSQRTVLDD